LTFHCFPELSLKRDRLYSFLKTFEKNETRYFYLVKKKEQQETPKTVKR
jgi:hypothetical protein